MNLDQELDLAYDFHLNHADKRSSTAQCAKPHVRLTAKHTKSVTLFSLMFISQTSAAALNDVLLKCTTIIRNKQYQTKNGN